MHLGLSLFLDDEGGYTTVAVAVALLVSISLVFAAASAEWVMARSYEVQPVADAAAMAGANSVAAYATIARVLDACVLSLGLLGVTVFGAGLVLSCIPGAATFGGSVCDAGRKVLDARRDFARSASEGLERLEKVLPAVVVANSAACVAENARAQGLPYVGCAIPFPVESQSDFSSMLALSDKEINQILLAVADAAINKTDFILSENQKDLERMPSTDPKYDRLKLTKSRLQDIAADIRNVAALPSPLGKVLKENVLPNGLKIKRVSVPFGVIGIIYEARPNVSFDVFSLCLKSGNACILKGGSDADYSNRAIISVIHEVLEHFNVDTHIVELLPADREATAELLHANDYVDLIIPRGSSSLINFVRQNATVPVIETGAGVCHTFFDRYGDISIGPSIIANAKTRRVSVCNALDCLIIEADSLANLPDLCLPLQSSNVEIFADEPAYHSLRDKYPVELLRLATEDCYGREFLDYKMAIKTVNSFQEALAHIRKYGSKHSECIITDDKTRAEWFCREVDAACVYVNAPTSFTDGAQFGLGAEIGISTQKLHARGPMALEEITTYKWIVEGSGQTRP